MDLMQKPNADFSLFVLYDSKVGNYRDPMIFINHFDCLRELEAVFRDPKNHTNQMVTNAEDFSVFKIGEYSRKTGIITSVQHEHIANLHEIRSVVMRQNIPLRNDAPKNKQEALFST